jgi:hypothetical protein
MQSNQFLSKIFATFYFFIKTAPRKQSPKRRKFAQSGVDVMIIFLRFFPILGEQNGLFLKYQCYDQFFSKFSFVLSQQRQFFRYFFGENF